MAVGRSVASCAAWIDRCDRRLSWALRLPGDYIGRNSPEVNMVRHVARMMEGDAFSTAVIKADAIFAAVVLGAAVAVHFA
jgi:hypothetical protein